MAEGEVISPLRKKYHTELKIQVQLDKKARVLENARHRCELCPE